MNQKQINKKYEKDVTNIFEMNKTIENMTQLD
jgi:hypothetical protein